VSTETLINCAACNKSRHHDEVVCNLINERKTLTRLWVRVIHDSLRTGPTCCTIIVEIAGRASSTRPRSGIIIRVVDFTRAARLVYHFNGAFKKEDIIPLVKYIDICQADGCSSCQKRVSTLRVRHPTNKSQRSPKISSSPSWSEL